MELTWRCAKCGGEEWRLEQTYFGMKGQHWTNGAAGLKKALDIGSRTFSVLICRQCSFTELYQVSNKGLQSKLELIERLRAESDE